ncbi:NAD-dependent epimerase/dehydratase family protein [Pseudoalteromonas sp. L21]|uniref:NAD-dependent epimerase/dehydratase family protein n=1 Tax=Pseudoalteromonas sp. L21 TaxID=1539746 RepID=UPI001F02959D|nr:NAD-dependent epimerase/dehydratase family protein [Pseudoalteromonas sp. L21]MCF7518022.1 NAD-dependent epimerase/dehydratase family protein [Pseudoalteromonas sp. L21]
MQTILGANGQIGSELALALKKDFTDNIRLVSRTPNRVNDTDELVSANLLDAVETQKAVEGSEVVYLTAGLPIDTAMWVEQFPLMMRNVIDACAMHKAKLVYFDNTYMYPQTNELLTEEIRFEPYGEKGRVRGLLAKMLLDAMNEGRVQAIICRAPEFYGPGKTQSITNTTVLDKLRAGESAKVFISDKTLRTLIYTPDASKAMALLGNTSDAYGQTWHLPCDDNRLTYKQLIDIASDILEANSKYTVLKKWQLKLLSFVSKPVRETLELLPRYEDDNLFVSDKFKARFPDFKITSYRDGLAQTLLENR